MATKFELDLTKGDGRTILDLESDHIRKTQSRVSYLRSCKMAKERIETWYSESNLKDEEAYIREWGMSHYIMTRRQPAVWVVLKALKARGITDLPL